MGRSSQWIYTFIILILLVTVEIRYIYLHGDAPAADISRSGVFYVDEGTYAHNVINKLLFDRWLIKNDYNAFVNVPIFSLSQYLILKILGISLTSLRTSGIIYTVLSLFFLWYLLKNQNLLLSFIAVLFGSLNYFFIIYNRLALLENLLILFLVLTSFCLYFYYNKNSVIWLIAATLIFWAGYFIKATILFFLPLLIATILFRPVTTNKKIRHLLIYFSLSSLILILIYLFWIYPRQDYWNYFQARNIHRMINESVLFLFNNYARYFFNLKLFQFMPITYSVSLFYLTYLFYDYYLKKNLSFYDWFFAGWAVCGFMFLGFFKYSPPRFSLILMPAIFTLTASFVVKLFQNKINFSDKNIFILLAPVTILSLCQISFGFYRVVIYKQNYLSCYLPMIAILIIFLFFLIINNKMNRKIIATFLFSSILLVNLFQIFQYYSTIKFSYYNAIQDMKKVIESQNLNNTVLLGDIAPLVSVELKTKAVNINFKSDTENKRILENRPNLIILQDNRELQGLTRRNPLYLKDVELIRSYKIFNNYRNNDNAYLYRVNNGFKEHRLLAKK